MTTNETSESHSHTSATACHAGFTVAIVLFAIQVTTGVLLMTVYSPSTTTAWSSVWYIQTQVPGGWLIRGVHHFASDALLIVLGLQLLWMVSRAAYRSTGARMWWGGMALLGLALSLSLSGHLLPWDQDGYWGTVVRTNILARTPGVGDALRRIIIGGSELGHLTLTRFYTLHILLLPAAVVLVLKWSGKSGQRHALPQNEENHTGLPESSDSEQKLRTWMTCAAVVACVFSIAGYTQSITSDELLAAPASPTASDYPARPEWHTLFLYQGLKYFEGPTMEVVGAMIIPGLVAMVFALFPWIHRAMGLRASHVFALTMTGASVLIAAALTFAAVWVDRNPTDAQLSAIAIKQTNGQPLSEADQTALRARRFHQQVDRAQKQADRAIFLARDKGIPPEGPLSLLANDPQTRGPELFAAHCASCHRFDGHNGLGEVATEPATSSDLCGFSTQPRTRGLLANPMGDRYFGLMKKPDGDPAHTRMSGWVGERMAEVEDDADRQQLFANLDSVSAYLEDESVSPGRLAHINAQTPEPAQPAPPREALILRGRRYFMATCNDCHSYNGERSGTLKAPEMFGYGSVAWIEGMISEPAHDTRYRSRGRERALMPAFADRLSDRDRRLIAQWLHDSRCVSNTTGFFKEVSP